MRLGSLWPDNGELATWWQNLLEKKSRKSAWVILYTSDKLILGKRSSVVRNPDQWNFFGGNIDAGEPTAEAAVRELEEETGYKIPASALRKISEVDGATYFTAKITDPENVKTTDETSKVKTFKLVDLPNNLHSKTQNFFDQLDHLLT